MTDRTVKMDQMRDLCVRRISAVTMSVSTSVTEPLMVPGVCVPQDSILVRIGGHVQKTILVALSEFALNCVRRSREQNTSATVILATPSSQTGSRVRALTEASL